MAEHLSGIVFRSGRNYIGARMCLARPNGCYSPLQRGNGLLKHWLALSLLVFEGRRIGYEGKLRAPHVGIAHNLTIYMVWPCSSIMT